MFLLYKAEYIDANTDTNETIHGMTQGESFGEAIDKIMHDIENIENHEFIACTFFPLWRGPHQTLQFTSDFLNIINEFCKNDEIFMSEEYKKPDK